MNLHESFRDATDNLSAHRLRAGLSMLGMIFGVGAVIAMLSIGEGAERQALAMIEHLGLHNIIVRAKPIRREDQRELRKKSPGLARRDAEAIREAVPGVELAAPRLCIPAYRIMARGLKTEANVHGISHRFGELTHLRIAEGRFLDSVDEKNHAQICVIGAGVRPDLFGYGPAVGELSNEQKETFLREAKVIKARAVGKGVTETWRLTLQRDGLTHDASFQYVDERAPIKNIGGGKTEVYFVDSYRYNIAAYRLAKLLGLDDMVPVSVERKWRRKTGALTWWVDDVMMDVNEMKSRGLGAPDPMAWSAQIYRVRVFTQLIYDTDRNRGNLLISKDWKICMIDFTRAFRRWHRLRSSKALTRCDHRLFENLRGLDRATLDRTLSKYLREVEFERLMARRDLIVEHYRSLIRTLGEEQVLYWRRQPRPRRDRAPCRASRRTAAAAMA